MQSMCSNLVDRYALPKGCLAVRKRLLHLFLRLLEFVWVVCQKKKGGFACLVSCGLAWACRFPKSAPACLPCFGLEATKMAPLSVLKNPTRTRVSLNTKKIEKSQLHTAAQLFWGAVSRNRARTVQYSNSSKPISRRVPVGPQTLLLVSQSDSSLSFKNSMPHDDPFPMVCSCSLVCVFFILKPSECGVRMCVWRMCLCVSLSQNFFVLCCAVLCCVLLWPCSAPVAAYRTPVN